MRLSYTKSLRRYLEDARVFSFVFSALIIWFWTLSKDVKAAWLLTWTL